MICVSPVPGSQGLSLISVHRPCFLPLSQGAWLRAISRTESSLFSLQSKLLPRGAVQCCQSSGCPRRPSWKEYLLLKQTRGESFCCPHPGLTMSLQVELMSQNEPPSLCGDRREDSIPHSRAHINRASESPGSLGKTQLNAGPHPESLGFRSQVTEKFHFSQIPRAVWSAAGWWTTHRATRNFFNIITKLDLSQTNIDSQIRKMINEILN